MPNKEQWTIVITPYYCTACVRVRPLKLPQKDLPSDPKAKRDGD